MADFVHLHLHTEWSLFDGIIRIDELFSKAQEFGYKAIAITDHASLFGLIYFYEKAMSSKIKPILGCEIFVANDHVQNENSPYHLILLCENNTGYKNLLKLCTKAYLENKGKRPTVTKQLLRKFSKGLIALSGCLYGEIPSAILKGKMDKAKNIAKEYAQIFPGRFYLEVQDNGIAEQQIINKGLLNLAKELDLPLVATNDCHYLLPEDAYAQRIRVCMKTNKKLSEETSFHVNTDKLYFAPPDEMIERFFWCKEAVENTLLISERCNVKLNLDNPLDSFLPQKQSYKELFEKKVWENFKKRLSELKSSFGLSAPEKEYQRRLEYEIEVIKRKGLCEYFLIAAELVTWAKSEGILKISPAYGTTASSLTAFILGITDIDPIRYGLFFERFLNPETQELPEIGIELPKDTRKKAVLHLKEKYGSEEHVAEITTFNRLSVRTLISNLQKIMQISSSKIKNVLKYISLQTAVSFKKSVQDEEEMNRLLKEDEEILKLAKIVMALEKLPYEFSTHSTGLLVSSTPISNFCPLLKKNKEKIATQFDLYSLNKLGLTQLNLLENPAFTLINLTIKLIEKNTKKSLKLYEIPHNDEKTYELLKKGDTKGVFLLESSNIKDFIHRAMSKGLSKAKAENIFSFLEKFTPYTFSKSHATSYALISYYTAYLKAHYLSFFMKACCCQKKIK